MIPSSRLRATLALYFAALAMAAAAQPNWTPSPPNPNAPYPAESRDANEQGTVLLRVRTTPDGQPVEVLVHQSSGFARLDRSALETVKKWQFRPTPDDGTVVWREVPISFFITSPPPRPVLN